MVLNAMLQKDAVKWDLQTLTTLTSAAWGRGHPESLRIFLRGLIRTRDLLAGLKVKEGVPYKWRLE